MEPLTNNLTDQELIESIERNIKLHREQDFFINLNMYADLISRFKSLTENRSELVEKCVEAVREFAIISHSPDDEKPEDDCIIDLTIGELTKALQKVLNPENK